MSDSTKEELAVVVSQPAPIPDPQINPETLALVPINGTTESAPPTHNSLPPPKKASTDNSWIWRARRRRFFRGLNIFGVGIVRVSLIVLGAIGVVIVFCLFMALPMAIGAAYGAIMLLIGNGILRAAHLAHYTDNAHAAAIGATGAILAAMCVGVLISWIPKEGEYGEEPQHPWYVQMAATVIVGTLSGTIGCAILLHNHVDLKGMDVLHATRAGALGGAIMGPGTIVIAPVFALVFGIILSPIWIAMMFGVEFVFSKSRENWTDTSHSYSMCYCYGTCGGDPEVDEEIRQIHAIQERHQDFGRASSFNNMWP